MHYSLREAPRVQLQNGKWKNWSSGQDSKVEGTFTAHILEPQPEFEAKYEHGEGDTTTAADTTTADVAVDVAAAITTVTAAVSAQVLRWYCATTHLYGVPMVTFTLWYCFN